MGKKRRWWKNCLQRHGPTVVGFLVSLFGNLTPIWMGWLLLNLFEKWTGFEPFWAHGEFYIYSTAFCTQSLYLLISHLQSQGRLSKTGVLLVLVSCLMLLTSAVLNSGITTGQLINAQDKVNSAFFMYSSWGLLFLSMVIFYGADYAAREALDVSEVERKEVNRMKDKLA